MMSALRKCPELLSVGYNFDETKKVAMVLYDEAILEFGADVVQPVSCDEMFIDISKYVKDIENGSETMEESENLEESKNRPFEILKTRLENLRKRIFEISSCSASIGCGRSTTIARLATKKCKPDGLLIVENSEDFMENQKFSDLPGIGPNTMTKLLLQNPEFTKDSTCADVVSKSGCLEKVFSVEQATKWESMCKGVYKSSIEPANSKSKQKSMALEMNFGIRCLNYNHVKKILTDLLKLIKKRLLDKFVVSFDQLQLTVNFRQAGHPLEPVKFGGMGICEGRTFTYELRKLRLADFDGRLDGVLEGMLESVESLEEVGIDCLDLRGFGFKCNKLDYSENKMKKVFFGK